MAAPIGFEVSLVVRAVGGPDLVRSVVRSKVKTTLPTS
jgi:hypothetical protein